MTPAAINTRINFYCGTDDTTFTQANKLPVVNSVKDEFASSIVSRAPSYFLIPSTFDLVADQREYGLGDDLLNSVHKVEIRFTSTGNRFPAGFLKSYKGSETEAEITKQFTNNPGEFFFTIMRRSLVILSGTIIAVTAGGRLLSRIYPADLANLTSTTDWKVDPSTTSFGMPLQFHELVARKVAMIWKGPNNKKFNDLDNRFDIDFELKLSEISNIESTGERVSDMPTGADLFTDGFDL